LKARNAVTPVALVVLAASAAAYAYLVDRSTVSDADRASRRDDVFPSFRIDEVRRVELVTRSEVLVLERESDAGVWAMASPRQETAEPAAVDVLLREMELATRVREVPPTEAPGLDAPRVRGRVAVGSLEYHFSLGADAPRPDGAAYMQVDGEGAFVVGRSLKVQLLRTADAYRDRALVPYSAGEIGRLEARAADGELVLQRQGTAFRLGSAEGLRASRAAVDRVFAALADARAEGFLDEAAAERAVVDSSLTMTITPRDTRRPRVRLLVGGACPGRADDVIVVRTEPTRVSACVAAGSVNALRVTADALVDKAPLFAHADEIEEVRLEALGATGPRVDLARRGTGWHERAPEDRDLGTEEADSATSLVTALAEAQAIDARQAAPADGVAPRARVTIVRTGGGSNATEVVDVAAPNVEGVATVRRLDDGALLRLPGAVARRFEPHPVALHALALWKEPFDPGEVVAIEDSCGPTPQRVELRNRAWVLRTPAGFAADAASVADLADAFAHAKADAWVDESDDGSFGLKRAGACTVTLTLGSSADGGAPRLVGLEFGAETELKGPLSEHAGGERGVYARTLGGQAVAVAPEALFAISLRPAIDRSRFRLDLPALTQVVLARGRSRLRLSRAGARLARDEDGGDAGRDDTLEAALAELSAQSAVHAGPPARDEGLDRPTLEITATKRVEGGLVAETRITIGAPTRAGPTPAYFARVSGIDATFALPRRPVDAILEAW
jgi:hypothetical protein